jgi:hypothetical protein
MRKRSEKKIDTINGFYHRDFVQYTKRNGERYLAYITAMYPEKNQCNMTTIEGKILKRSTINKEYFLRMAEDDQKAGFNLVKTLFEKENYVKFPLWDVDLVIWKDCFEKLNDSNSLARYLEEKAFRVYFARRAGVITLEGNVQLSVWDFNDVIFGKVNYITISEDVSKEELFFVPWKEFLTSNFVKYDTIPRNKNELPYYFIYGIDRSKVGEAFEYYKTLSISMEDIKRMNNE